MSAEITVTPLATYRNERPYPFCPGCGHGPILDCLDRALVELGIDPRRVVLVSDIGCSGLSDQYFVTSALHGLHGRSLTYASGIKLARPDLEVIVVMGDGGTGIGGAHLLNAARRNIGLTLLVFNNLNFGMTGGQHSATTPPGAVTSTTPGGNLERPLDLCATVAVNGAAYAWRGTSFDADLPERIAEAVRTPGFAVLDVWEPCTAYFVPNNKLSKKALYETLDRLGFATGVLTRRTLPEYAAAYREAHGEERGAPGLAGHPVAPLFRSRLDRRCHLVVAGSAGGRVRSAVRLVAEAALLSGLWAAQRDDYPITVRSGHSVSELVLSPEEIHYTGGRRPDALLLLSADGRQKAGRYLAEMRPGDRVFALPSEAAAVAQATVIDPALASGRVARGDLAVVAVAAMVRRLGVLPPEALEEAARRSPAAYVEANVAAVTAGLELAGRPA